MGGFTRMLREAPLLELNREVGYAAPRRTRTRLVRRAGLAVAFAGFAAAAVLSGLAVSGPGGSSRSALAFQNLAQQQLFADIEVRRFEPAVFLVAAPPRCIGRCALN
jgi:hypothetical protein